MNKTKKVIILSLLLGLSFILTGQDITGTWSGMLETGTSKLRIVFNIEKSGEGYAATMDSPNQGLKGFPVSSVTQERSNLSIVIRNLNFIYEGSVVSDILINGVATQQGMQWEVPLKKGEPEMLYRPQEPKPPFPYRSEEISFSNEKAGAVLAGMREVYLLEVEYRHYSFRYQKRAFW